MSSGATKMPRRKATLTSRKIDWIMDELDISQNEMERRTGIEQPRYSRWRRGYGEPPLAAIHSIAQALKVPWQYLADNSRLTREPVAHLRREMELYRLVRKVGVEAAILALRLAEAKAKAED